MSLHQPCPMSSESVGGAEKPKLEIKNIFLEWDGERTIRDHLATEGSVLFPEKMAESVKTSVIPHIRDMLTPVLKKMAMVHEKPQPSVDPLRDELAALYHRHAKQVQESQIIRDSWMVRKFLGFIKMKCRIKKPSTAPWL